MATKILLVSHDKKLDEKLKDQVKDHTFSITHESSGGSAISKIKSSKPEIVMLDIDLPKKNGWEILEEMQGSKTLAKVPVVLVDERNTHKNEIEAFERGAAAYTSKAAAPELLLQKLYSIQMLAQLQSKPSKSEYK